MGDNEVTTTPNYNTSRADDRSKASGIQGKENGRSLMGTTGTSATVQTRQTGVVRRTAHSHVTPHCKVSPKTIRPLSHHQSVGTSHISTPASRTVEHPPRVPCRS